MTDTTPEALAAQRATWRRLGPEVRVRVAVELSEATRRIALAGLARRHPELDDAGLVRLLITRIHGIDLTDLAGVDG